jgi:hypothetical protein
MKALNHNNKGLEARFARVPMEKRYTELAGCTRYLELVGTKITGVVLADGSSVFLKEAELGLLGRVLADDEELQREVYSRLLALRSTQEHPVRCHGAGDKEA